MTQSEIDNWLGRTYEDKISKFKGVCTGYVRYITGCDQVLLSAPIGADGSEKTLWTDVQRAVEVDADRIVLDNGETPGFDVAAPVR